MSKTEATKHLDLSATRTAPAHPAKKEWAERTQRATEELQDLQRRFYADGKNALLIIFQAMDGAGKDGSIQHVMSGVNPQGCSVASFKQPSPNELAHDYLWRVYSHLPARGMIGIFNRSYYEDVLVVRVHPELLAKQRLQPSDALWAQRFKQIRHFEEHLYENGTHLLKFFLHLSKKEQKRRFLSRLKHAEKNWKFSAADLAERAFWDSYQEAYQEALRHTTTKHAPWHVIPADDKAYSHMLIAETIVRKLQELHPHYPAPSPEQKQALAAAKQKLL